MRSLSTSTAATHMTKRVVIVGAKRTPTGSLGGALAATSAPELGAVAIAAALKQANNLDPKLVDEVYFGNVIQAGVGQAPARQAALGAGLPPSVCCTTVNKVCASGLKAVSLAFNSILLGDAQIVVAGGMESMSGAPFLLPEHRFGKKYGDSKVQDALSRDGLQDAYSKQPMGNCGEQCASEEKISRQQQDEYAAQSFARAVQAQKEGKFVGEIAPVQTKKALVDKDDIKPTSLEQLAKLRTVFSPPNSVTAGNASTINDGASALVLMSEERAIQLGMPILATVLASADAETDPNHFTIAPSLAIPKALAKCGNPKVDFYEINEAFSVVALANMQRLNIDPKQINVYGGAVALGHPLGSSGSRILVTLLNVLQREGGKIGVAAICNGGGGATALVVEAYQPKAKL